MMTNLTNKEKNNHVNLTILFDNKNKFVFQDFNLIIQVLDVTFEDVHNNIIFETRHNFSVSDIKSRKLKYGFDVKLENHDKIYTIFILVDTDKDQKISIDDYISMHRHVFMSEDEHHDISIIVYKVTS